MSILHHQFVQLFPEDERERGAVQVKSTSAINQAKQVRKDGSPFFVDMWISPVEYPGRKALLVITSDITKRLEAEQQLIQASKMATLGEMATGVAHELNQPLAVIKTASRFFIKKVRNKEPIPEHIISTLSEEIDGHVDRATKIINHMREFGRKSDKRLDPISINEVLNRTSEIFSQQLKARGVDIVWELADKLPRVRADVNRLEQVFINLLINARDAIEEKTLAHPHLKGEKKIYITSRRRDGMVQVEVRDTGKGIPKSLIAKVFEPFFTTKEVGKGTGLGLSISYQIVKDFGGTIRALSREGDGASFIISFPAVEG
jgi:histidine kinase